MSDTKSTIDEVVMVDHSTPNTANDNPTSGTNMDKSRSTLEPSRRPAMNMMKLNKSIIEVMRTISVFLGVNRKDAVIHLRVGSMAISPNDKAKRVL